MGCEGCELWPKTVKFVSELVKEAKALTHRNEGDLKSLVQEIVGSRSTSQIYQERKLIAETIAKQLKLSEDGTRRLVDVIRLLSKETLNKAHLTKFILA